jgi:hypothetical protein
LSGAAAWAGLACFVLEIAFFALMHLREPRTRVLSDAVSYFALGDSARIFLVYLGMGALGSALLALSMLTSPTLGVSRLAVGALALSVLARLGVMRFKTGRGSWAPSGEGRLHLVFAVLSFACSYTVIHDATGALSAGAPALFAISLIALRWIAAASLAACLLTMIPRLRAAFGMFERAFLGSTMLWFVLAALRLT